MKLKLFGSRGLLVNITVAIGVIAGFLLFESFALHILSWPPLYWTFELLLDWIVPGIGIAILVLGLAGMLVNAYCHVVLRKPMMRIVDEWQDKRNANKSQN